MARQSAETTGIERTTVATGLTYGELVAAFERELGRWDPNARMRSADAPATWGELEAEIGGVAGRHGLMILGDFDQGTVVSLSGQPVGCSLYLVGNPLIAARILRVDLRASLYVPFRVCLYDDEGPDGACISFDRPSSSLGTLKRPELTEIGALLDRKIDGVVAAMAVPG